MQLVWASQTLKMTCSRRRKGPMGSSMGVACWFRDRPWTIVEHYWRPIVNKQINPLIRLATLHYHQPICNIKILTKHNLMGLKWVQVCFSSRIPYKLTNFVAFLWCQWCILMVWWHLLQVNIRWAMVKAWWTHISN